ncbi:hypothetical protein [Streptomyces sp. NPDC003006]
MHLDGPRDHRSVRRRLEFGFVGVDSLGRHYNQRPFPHLRPAVGTVGPLLVHALGQAMAEEL